MKPEAGWRLGAKYTLVRPLAQGGMGSVWVGRHLELDTPVAIKFIEPELARREDAVRRFRREARAAAKLQSPHIARIYDYGVEAGTPYMAMELLEGETLMHLLDRKGRLRLPRVAAIVRQLAKGLGEAHAAGIVHRDIKPSNVFLARIAGEEIVKILDFGIAKEQNARLEGDGSTTRSGVLMGSPRYMSPEQARGSPVDHRSDLWSLGVLIFEALTGRPLFVTQHYGDLIAAITGDCLPVPSEVAADLGPDVDAFFERALARNPKVRFSSAHEVARALAEVAARAKDSAEGDLDVGGLDSIRPMGEETAEETTVQESGDSSDGAGVPGRDAATMAASSEAVTSLDAPLPDAMGQDLGVTSTISDATAPRTWARRWPIWGLGAAGVAFAVAIAVAMSSKREPSEGTEGPGPARPSAIPSRDDPTSGASEAAPHVAPNVGEEPLPDPVASATAPETIGTGKEWTPAFAPPLPPSATKPESPSSSAKSTIGKPGASSKSLDPVFGVPVSKP